jgi:glycosyltransferase involved in cell wall biosynthesis
LAIASHPIQYHVPLYRLLTERKNVQLRVAYCREYGNKPTFDKQFGRAVHWDTELLGGYEHVFLRNFSPIDDTFNPLHAFNPSIATEVRESADVIWINGLMYPTNWMAIAAARQRRTPILLRSELYPAAMNGGSLRSALKQRFYRQALTAVDGVLTIGTLNHSVYSKLGVNDERMTLTPYAVEMGRFQVSSRESAERRRERRATWGLNDDDVAVIFLGKLTSRKHPEMLLALDHCENADRLAVVWVGAGELEPQLQEEASKMVRARTVFAGMANQSEIPDVLWASDIFVMPSEQEPWGLVLNEAMAAGLPSVVSDQVGAAADLCVDGVTGYVTGFGDVEALLTAVDRLAASDELRTRLGVAARERISRWSPEAAANGIEQAAFAALSRRNSHH